MPDGQQFSTQDIQDLQQIAAHLPPGHPMQGKLSKLLNSQPTQFEKDRVTPFGSALVRGAKAVGSDLAGVASGIGDAITGGVSGAMSRAPAAAANFVAADQNRKDQGYSPLYRGVAGATTATGVLDPSGMEESARRGDTAGVVGHGLVPAASAATLLAKGPVESARGLGPARDAIGLALRDEAGALKPAVKATARVAGAGLGHLSGLPGIGEVGGFLAGSPLADAIIPKRPFDIPTKGASVGAPLPGVDEFYENRGKDLMTRETAQRLVERRAATDKRFAGRTELPENPFGNATPTNVVHGNTEVPSFGGPAAPKPEVQFVNKFAPPEPPQKGLIVSPDTPPPPRKVTYQSAAQPDLLKKVMSGDREAIAEWDRRSLPRPPGVGFMVEPSAPTIPWGRPR
jgi:hypothetical protein